MYPQDPQNEPSGLPPEPHTNPGPSEEPAAFPQPADAWPPRQEPVGDTEPATGSNLQSAPTAPSPATDELIRQAGPMDQAPTAAPLGSQTRPGRRIPKLVIALVVILVLVGVGALAYAWYEAPAKVLTDSISQLVTAKSLKFSGTATMKSDASNLSVVYDGASTQQEVMLHGKITTGTDGKPPSLEANAITDKGGNYYVKVSNIKDILGAYLTNIPAEMQPAVNQVITKIDDKWIKIPASDTSPVAAGATKVQQCVRTAFGKVQTDTSYRNELTNLYDKQQFIAVNKNLGIKDMAIGYRLGIDITKERAFVDGFGSTKLYADLKKCDDSIRLDDYKLATDAKSLPEFEVWSNIFTHQPKQITVMSPSSETSSPYSISFAPVLNAAVKIDIPTDTTDFSTIQADLFGLMIVASSSSSLQQAANTNTAQRTDTSKNQTNAVSLQKHVEAYNAMMDGYPTFAQIMAVPMGQPSTLDPSLKAVMVPRTAAKGDEIGLVPCKDSTRGGTISYVDATYGTIKSITYGMC